MERLAQRLKELMGDFAAPGQEHLVRFDLYLGNMWLLNTDV